MTLLCHFEWGALGILCLSKSTMWVFCYHYRASEGFVFKSVSLANNYRCTHLVNYFKLLPSPFLARTEHFSSSADFLTANLSRDTWNFFHQIIQTTFESSHIQIYRTQVLHQNITYLASSPFPISHCSLLKSHDTDFSVCFPSCILVSYLYPFSQNGNIMVCLHSSRVANSFKYFP